MNEKYKSLVIEDKLKETVFENYDFTNTVFTCKSLEKQIENAKFINCIFDKTAFGLHNFNGKEYYATQRFWHSVFTNCKFKGVDMRSVFWGHNSIVENCHFLRCNFCVDTFSLVDFINCVFEKCKCRFKSDEALFENCKFIGKLSEVEFCKRSDNPARANTIKSVDFSEAILGDYVAFTDIDMNNCIPPKGKTWEELLYQFEEINPHRLSTGDKERSVISKETSLWLEEQKNKRL